LGRSGMAICGKCSKTTKPKEMDSYMLENYEKQKKNVRIPVWHFSGLVLIAIIIVVGYFGSVEDKKNELKYLSDPKVGDVYVVESPETAGSYSTVKVSEVMLNGVVIQPNNYEISKLSSISKIDIPGNYSDELLGAESADILEMYKNGEIYDVIRK